MIRFVPVAAVAVLFLGACVDETPVAVNEAMLAPDFSKMDWVLNSVDGKAPGFNATLNLGEPGRISGRAPCNTFSGPVMMDGTAFKAGPLLSTEMACPDLEAEATFLSMLGGVDHAERMPGMLILSGGGHQLEFAQPIE